MRPCGSDFMMALVALEEEEGPKLVACPVLAWDALCCVMILQGGPHHMLSRCQPQALNFPASRAMSQINFSS